MWRSSGCDYKPCGRRYRQNARTGRAGCCPRFRAICVTGVPISFLAGIGEEIAFRGVAFGILREISGSTGFAIVICVLAFGFAHMTQGWRGVLGTGVIALVMHGIVYATAGLYLAIAIHVAYDLMLGFIAMRQFMQEGAQLALQPQPAPSG